MLDLDREMAIAVQAVRAACGLCQRVRAALVTEDTMTKEDRSPVTVADLGAQAVMSHILGEAIADVPLMAEEDTEMLRSDDNAELQTRVVNAVRSELPALSEAAVLRAIDRGRHVGGPTGRFWTLDPIDGTKGFIRGDQYAVALALIEDGAPVLGVLGCPNLPAACVGDHSARGIVMAARKGLGAFQSSLTETAMQPIRVAAVKSPASAAVCQSVESGHTSHSRAERIAERLGITRPAVRLDSQCKYAVVARGEADVYMRLPSRNSTYEERIWDHAAGAVVVAAAGGVVTDTAGKPLDFSQGRTLRNNVGILATGGGIHDAVVAAVQSVLADS